jgi:hypothetical protein
MPMMLADQTSPNTLNKTQKFQVAVYMSVLLKNQTESESQQPAYKCLPSPCLCRPAMTPFFSFIYL